MLASDLLACSASAHHEAIPDPSALRPSRRPGSFSSNARGRSFRRHFAGAGVQPEQGRSSRLTAADLHSSPCQRRRRIVMSHRNSGSDGAYASLAPIPGGHFVTLTRSLHPPRARTNSHPLLHPILTPPSIQFSPPPHPILTPPQSNSLSPQIPFFQSQQPWQTDWRLQAGVPRRPASRILSERITAAQ